MSLLKAIKAQLGLSNTPANNFTITAEADNGTLKLARGNAGATTQDLITVSANNIVTGAVGATLVGNGPAFSAYQNAGQSITSSASKVLFQVEEYDTNNSFISSTFTPTIPGYYHLSVVVQLAGASNGMSIMLYKNGSLHRYLYNSSATQNNPVINGSCDVLANGTDKFEVYMTSTTTLNTSAVQNANVFQGFLVRGI